MGGLLPIAATVAGRGGRNALVLLAASLLLESDAGNCAGEPSAFSSPRDASALLPKTADVSNPLGAAFTAGRTGMAALDDKRRLSVGDHLFFQILEDKDDPKQLTITDSGGVEVPYLGLVSAQGVTCKQLATVLKKELEAKYYYHATVIISVDSMSKALGKVYASGALRTPGRMEIPGNEVFTVSKAVLCAGGFSDVADKRHVRVTRRLESGGTNELFTVDVGEILEKGRTDMDLPLEPGDMIFVPERLNIF